MDLYIFIWLSGSYLITIIIYFDVNITNIGTNQHLLSPYMMYLEGHSITSLIFLPKIHSLSLMRTSDEPIKLVFLLS